MNALHELIGVLGFGSFPPVPVIPEGDEEQVEGQVEGRREVRPGLLGWILIVIGMIVLGRGCADSPTALFSADPTTGNAPLEVQFTDQSLPGSSEITSWAWDFGDTNTSDEQNPTHTYATDNTYTVSLTVTNAHGSNVMTRDGYIDVGVFDSPVIGVIPGPFTTDGGPLEVSVSPVDGDGTLITDVTTDCFTFSPMQVAHFDDPGTIVASCSATPNSIILPGTPGTPGAGVSAAILLDSSGSMGQKGNDDNRDRVAAAKAFVDMLGPEDQAAILDFGSGSTSGLSDTRLLQEFTSDHDLLYAGIDMVAAVNGTPFYDSLYETIGYVVDSAVPNPSILVLTDGLDYGSDSYGQQDVVDFASSSAVPVFVVGLGDGINFSELQALALGAGGTFASVRDSTGLDTLFENMGIAVISGRIVVHASCTFTPALPEAGKYSISGELMTTISGLTVPTPFIFVADVVSVGDGLVLKRVANQ